MATDEKSQSECVFCKIVNGKDEKTTLLYQDGGLTAFKDIKPAAKHHYLIVPVTHIKNPKSLTRDHIELVEQMVEVGKQVLTEQGGDLSEARFGFHWPPFVLVNHLHLHVISPNADIGFLNRQIFRPNSYWFVGSDWLIDKLKSLPESGKL